MRLRHLQWAVLLLSIAMAMLFPAIRQGRRARASATVLTRESTEIESGLIRSRPVLKDALADPLFRLSDQPALKNASDPIQALAETVHATPRFGTDLIEISAEADRRDDALALVDAVLVAYLRTRPVDAVQVTRNTTAVSSAWSRPHFAAYLGVMVVAVAATFGWCVVLILTVTRIRRQARARENADHPPNPPAGNAVQWHEN